jgi:hypothetical protein
MMLGDKLHTKNKENTRFLVESPSILPSFYLTWFEIVELGQKKVQNKNKQQRM